MKKYFLIALLLCGFYPNVFSQLSPAQLDSLRIDSLKKQFPVLKGVDKVDRLNVLARTIRIGNFTWAQQPD